MTPRPTSTTKIIPTIRPTDPSYQIDPELKPDKESTWPYPAEKDGWVIAHNSIRGEMQLFKDALQAIKKRDASKSLEAWELVAIRTAAAAHFEHIHSHHENEDDILVPAIKTRFHYPKKLCDDHETLVQKMTAIEKTIADLQTGDKIDDLYQQWSEYQSMMIPHLEEEEQVGLPLLRAYFTQNDIKPIIQKLVAKSPKAELGSLIYFEGKTEFRQGFMKQEKIPFFVWYIDFQSKYKYFCKVFITPLQALIDGKEPSIKPGCFIF